MHYMQSLVTLKLNIPQITITLKYLIREKQRNKKCHAVHYTDKYLQKCTYNLEITL